MRDKRPSHPVAGRLFGPGIAPADFFPAEEESRLQAEKAAEQLVGEAIQRRGRAPATAVTVRAVCGLAADELISASDGADLLIRTAPTS